jgi:hypothetical protein
VEAPGYRKSDETVPIAGAEKRVTVALVADSGRVNVTTDDPEAAIYVDGKEGAYGKWSGPVSAGVPHTITVFKPGYNPSNVEVTVATGETRDVKATVGARFQGGSAPPTPYPYVRPVTPEKRHGPYVLVGATAFQMSTMPDNLSAEGSSKPSGTYFGARAGYLLIPNLGIEAMFEAGRHSTSACFNATTACSSANANVDANIDFTGYRFGVAGRYITGGETFRFLADLGFGAVFHKLTLSNDGSVGTGSMPKGSGSAIGGTVFGDIGLEVSITHVLLDFVLSAAGDGVSGIDVGGAKAFSTSSGTAGFGGLGVRVGYGFW